MTHENESYLCDICQLFKFLLLISSIRKIFFKYSNIYASKMYRYTYYCHLTLFKIRFRGRLLKQFRIFLTPLNDRFSNFYPPEVTNGSVNFWVLPEVFHHEKQSWHIRLTISRVNPTETVPLVLENQLVWWGLNSLEWWLLNLKLCPPPLSRTVKHFRITGRNGRISSKSLA